MHSHVHGHEKRQGIDMGIGVCRDMGIDMCRDRGVGMCRNMGIDMQRHGSRHVHRHGRRHGPSSELKAGEWAHPMRERAETRVSHVRR